MGNTEAEKSAAGQRAMTKRGPQNKRQKKEKTNDIKEE